MSRREIRCPVHGFIDRSQTEQKVIDCQVVQRLRRISQLALANLVYPGATHTRFGHSLGVMHIAGSMARCLDLDQEETGILRLAALLHDIGHGPFSHVSEEVFEELRSLEGNSIAVPPSVHEALTKRILLSDEELLYYLGQDKAEQISKVLDGKADTLATQLLSGTIDADKQDYLLRDSYFCGVKYGLFDIERLHNTLRCHPDAGDRFLAVRENGVHAVEQFILARYYLTTQVYRHRVRLSTDAMIKRAILLGVTEDRIPYLCDLFTYDDSDNYTQQFLNSDDQSVISRVMGRSNGKAKRLMTRLLERKLFKQVFTRRVSEFGNVARNKLSPPESSLKLRIEQAVAEKLGIPAASVAVASFNVRSVREMRTDPQDRDRILVLRAGGSVRYLDEESVLVSNLSQASSEYFLDIYGDVEFDDEQDKKRKRQEYDKDIFDIVNEIAQKEGDDGPQSS